MKTLFRIVAILTTLSVLVSAAPARPAHAAVAWTVNVPVDATDGECVLDCSLRDAIALATAAGGGTVNFDPSLAGVTIPITLGPLFITQPIVIDGTGLTPHVIIDGLNATEVFIVVTPVVVSLTGLDIVRGAAVSIGVGGAVSILQSGASVTAMDITFNKNSAPVGGGAVYLSPGATFSVLHSTFSENTSPSTGIGGGAIFSYGSLTVDSTSFLSNATGGAVTGGAIYNAETAVVSNSTFHGNDGGGLGAGIYNGGTLTLQHASFSMNSGSSTFVNNGAASVENTILADTVGGVDCTGNALTINAGNIIETLYGCSTPASTADPGFGVLGNYGGPTQMLPILPASPAFDAASTTYCTALDQRGVMRPWGPSGACDIGAFEFSNAAATDISLDVTTIAENAASGTTVGTLSATDPDVGDTHTFSLACTVPGADDASFGINGASLQTAAVFDYESRTQYAICVQATDAYGATYDENFTIDVTDENEPPTVVLSNTTTSYSEDGYVLNPNDWGDITVTDDALGAESLALSGADASMFEITGTDLVLKANVTLDHETNPQLDVTVEVDDTAVGATPDDSDSLSVTILDADELPTDLSISDSNVDENAAIGEVVGTLNGTDPDDGDSVTFSLTCATAGADDASFAINGDELQTAEMFDYETRSTYAVCVRVTDSCGDDWYDEALTVNVTNLVDNGTLVANSTSTKDGWVLESGENSNVGGTKSASGTLRLGDNAARKQYRSILSFDTSQIDSTATITGINLTLQPVKTFGSGDPATIFDGVMIDIMRGSFRKAKLQLSDFQTTAGSAKYKSFGPFTPAGSGPWSFDLHSDAFPYINMSGGPTQIRLRFKLGDNNNGAANYITLYGGEGPSGTDRPTLTVTFTTP